MKPGYHYGDAVLVTGSTGKQLPAVLVTAGKTRAVVRIWKAATGRFGSPQSYDWEDLCKAKQEIYS